MDDETSVHIGAIWKSPRDRTRCIQATLRSYNDAVFADFRMLTLDSGTGRMVASDQRLTVSAKQLGKFTKLVGDSYRKAAQLNLVTVISS